MSEKRFEVWSGWLPAMTGTEGMWGEPQHHGTFSAETFGGAVIAWRDSLDSEHSRSCVEQGQDGSWRFWGCDLYPSQQEAFEGVDPESREGKCRLAHWSKKHLYEDPATT